MSKFKNILFDMDGTIVNSLHPVTLSAEYALMKLGVIENNFEELVKFIGPPLHESFIQRYFLSPEDSMVAVGHYRRKIKEFGLDTYKPYLGIIELINELSANKYKLFLATSKPIDMAMKILNHLNLEKVFEFVSGANADETSADKGLIISEVLRLYELDKNSTVMIGDRKFDIIGARANGIKSIGILHGFGSKEELAEFGADYIVQDSIELRTLLLG